MRLRFFHCGRIIFQHGGENNTWLPIKTGWAKESRDFENVTTFSTWTSKIIFNVIGHVSASFNNGSMRKRNRWRSTKVANHIERPPTALAREGKVCSNGCWFKVKKSWYFEFVGFFMLSTRFLCYFECKLLCFVAFSGKWLYFYPELIPLLFVLLCTRHILFQILGETVIIVWTNSIRISAKGWY